MSAFIDQGRERYGVEPICRSLGVSASAYYQRAAGQRSARAMEDERLLERIRDVHAANYHAYGYRRMWKALLRAGERVSRCRVRRLMRAHGIEGAKRRGRPWRTTRPDPGAARRPDLVKRDFTAPAANRLWVGDFTYLRCWEGVVYFAFILDVFSRMIVGWQLAANMRTDLVLDALRMALGLRAPGADFELVAHTDAGSQYTSRDDTQVLDDHEVLQSIGTVADALDNALAESFIDSYKTELIADRVWRSRAQLELATVEYVGWFNHQRLHEALGDIPPVEFEQRHALTEPVDEPFSGNGSVAVSSPRAPDGLRMPRFSTLGIDPGATSPIQAINGTAIRGARAQAAPRVVELPAPTAGLSDRRFREILADNNINDQRPRNPPKTVSAEPGPAHRQIQQALGALQLAGRATRAQLPTGGRPADLWTATTPAA